MQQPSLFQIVLRKRKSPIFYRAGVAHGYVTPRPQFAESNQQIGNRSFPCIHRVKNFGGFFVRNRTDGFRLPGLNPNRNLLFQGAIHMNKFAIVSTEEQWRQQAEAARQEAENLPFGKRREALVRKARQLRTASEIDRWLLSPELQRPI